LGFVGAPRSERLISPALRTTMTARRKTFDGLDAEALAYSEKGPGHCERRRGPGASRPSTSVPGLLALRPRRPRLEDLREALQLGLEWGLGLETAFAYLNLGDWLWQVEGPKSGLKVHREGIAFAERRGLRQVAMWIRAETTWMLFELGG
jgi:hypothetical protein